MRKRTENLSLLKLEDRLAPAIINFNLTQATSILNLGGSINGATMNPQSTSPNSLSTTYTGTVQADVDFSAGTIQILSAGTASAADNSGNWQPGIGGIAGTAAANYGGKVATLVSVLLAVRDSTGTLESTVTNLSGAGATKTFASTTGKFTLTGGTTDYRYTGLQSGSGTNPNSGSALNAAATNSSFTDNSNGTYAIVLPIDITINYQIPTPLGDFPGVNTIKGTLNATATLPVVDLNSGTGGFDTMFTYMVGGAPVTIAPSASITEVGSPNLTSMTVALQAPPDGAAEALAVDLTGTSLSTSGYDPGSGQLVITGGAALATYQSVLQKVTYANSAMPATLGDRTVTVTVSDGFNTSLVRTATGTVIAPTAAQVQSVVVNDGTDQRSLVTSLTVNFDSKISPDPTVAAFQLIRNSDSANVNLSLAVDNSGPTTKATLSFTGGAVNGISLADGRYNLTINGGLINGGNFNGGSGVGSNYQLVGDPTTGPKLYRLFGDADGNNVVNATDFNAFRLVYGSPGMSIFDFDSSGSVTAADFNEFRLRYGASV